MSQSDIRRSIVEGFGIKDPREIPALRAAYDRPVVLSPGAAPRLERHLAPPPGPRLAFPDAWPPADIRAPARLIHPHALPAPQDGPPVPPPPPRTLPPMPAILRIPSARTLAAAPPPADPGLMRAIEAALLAGGLWRPADLAEEASADASRVSSALGHLARDGLATQVALGHWRSRRRDACLVDHGRTASARMLGSLLHGLSLDVGYVAEALDLDPREAASAPAELVRQSLAIELRPGTYRCPDPVRMGIIGRLGPAPLTQLGRRIVDVLFTNGPLRKSEAADAAGIGRGSANRMIDRLVEDGWLSPRGDDRFAVA